MKKALRTHWPEYLMEAGGLGLFMVAACIVAVLLWHPMSPAGMWAGSETRRRLAAGAAMGLTSTALTSSPWGRRSGAHFNPALTFTFFLLGKVKGWDTLFYAMAQFAGGALGVAVASLLIGPPLSNAAVRYAVTVPGQSGPWRAFAAEVLISMLLISVVLWLSNHRDYARWTPVAAGLLVASFIFFVQPVSGMSMNPARTFASAAGAAQWTSIWIYFTAPPLGMAIGALLHCFRFGRSSVLCAKLDHQGEERCIFNCARGNKTKQVWISELSGDNL